MAQPILRTERLVLEPLADHHRELEVQLDADPEVMRHLTGRARTREEVCASHAGRMLAARDGLGYWIAVEAGGPAGDGPGGPDGFVGLMMLPAAGERGAAELGYRLRRAKWRRGYATEASRALLRYGFEVAGLRRVFAQTMAVNTGSRRVLEAAGLRYVRTFFPDWDEPLPGSEHGEVEYELRRGDSS